MKKKSQIELFMPINEDISGMHRPNKDVNNLDDSECEPCKSFTDDDSSDDNLRKEALGLFDLPAGAPDGAQNFRVRDSYKKEDFEASEKTGFGAPYLDGEVEHKHPINIQRRDEFNSANNDENRKKDFFSFLGFKTTGRSMNKELEKLASVLSKSGYSNISDNIMKFSSEEHDELKQKAIMQATNLITWAASHSEENSSKAEEIKDLISSEEYDKAIDSRLVDLIIKFINDAEPDFDDDELPAAKNLLAQMISGSRGAEDTANNINKIYYANNLDDETREVISDASAFATSARALIKLKDKKEKSEKKKEDKKKKDKLTKDQRAKREAEWEAERANSKIVDEWYDSKSKKYIAKNDRGELLERNDSTMQYEFIDGYPAADWKISKDDDFRLWRASKKYKVMQYKDDNGKWKNYPLGKFAKEDKMKKISSRDTLQNASGIIKVAQALSNLSPEAIEYFERNSRKRTRINSADVLNAQMKGTVTMLWKGLYEQAVTMYENYHRALDELVKSIRYTAAPGSALALPNSVRSALKAEFYWWKTSTPKIKGKFADLDRVVSGLLDGAGVTRQADSYFTLNYSTGQLPRAKQKMLAECAKWDKISDTLIECYKAIKEGGGQGGGQGKAKRGNSPVQPVKEYKGHFEEATATIVRVIDANDHVWVCGHKMLGGGCKNWAPLIDAHKKLDLDWGDDKKLYMFIDGGWNLHWSGSAWVRTVKSSHRNKRLLKTGAISIRKARLIKLAGPPKRKGRTPKSGTGKSGKGGGGGGGSVSCGVPIQPNLNKANYFKGNATNAQTKLKEYKNLGKIDGNWGACSHSAWLLFIQDLENQGLKSDKYKSRIKQYTSALRSNQVTDKVIDDALKAYQKLGGSTPGAAASTITSFDDLDAQVSGETESKLFTNDLLIKYLLGDYDKPLLTDTSKPVGKLLADYGTKLLRVPKQRKGMKQRPSIIAGLPPRLKTEFEALFGTTQEGGSVESISWDWRFLKYRAGRGTYILTRILGGKLRAEVIKSLKQEVCGINPGETGACSKEALDDLKSQKKERTNISLSAEISAADKESQDDDAKQEALNQDNMDILTKELFKDADKTNEALLALETEGSKYIATNGAIITQEEDMADMMRENREAGKIESMLPDLITTAAESFKARLYSNASMYGAVGEIVSERYNKDTHGPDSNRWRITQMARIEEAIKREHRGLDNWRSGYLFEGILKSAKGDIKEETDSSWFFGVGADTRQEILQSYMQQASDPTNKLDPESIGRRQFRRGEV